MKRCNKCGEEKDHSKFWSDKRHTDGKCRNGGIKQIEYGTI